MHGIKLVTAVGNPADTLFAAFVADEGGVSLTKTETIGSLAKDRPVDITEEHPPYPVPRGFREGQASRIHRSVPPRPREVRVGSGSRKDGGGGRVSHGTQAEGGAVGAGAGRPGWR